MRMGDSCEAGIDGACGSLLLPGGVRDRMASGSFCRRGLSAKRLWGGASWAQELGVAGQSEEGAPPSVLSAPYSSLRLSP